MKSAQKLIGIVVFVMMAVLSIAACKNDPPEITLESIVVTTMPTKVQYNIGEEFNPAGMVVTAVYDDGSSAEVAGYTLGWFDSSAVSDVIVTVSFGDKTDTFTVTVGKTLESIAVTAIPTKTQYKIGENVDRAGMVVTGTYSDGSTAAIEGYTTSVLDSATIGNKMVTVSYGGKNAVFMVTVYKTLESIAVTTMPAKVHYNISDEFNPAGMVVTADYDDSSSAEVAGYTLSGFDSSIAGGVTVTVTFEGKQTVFNVTIRQLESFTITFAQIADAAPQINGPTIYLIDRTGKPSQAEVAVDDPDQYDPGSIKWYVNNGVFSSTSVMLDSSGYGNTIGEYFIMVEVKKGSVPYSQTVTFTVAP